MLRRVTLSLALSALACAGVASAVLAGGPSRAAGSTTTATTTPATTVTSAARTTIVLNGHGWGHGLGMSQWGANGYAKRGWTYDQILGHYYAGTTLGPAPVKQVRVLLTEAKKVTLNSVTAWKVTDASGEQRTLQPGKLPLAPTLKLSGVAAPLAPPLTFSAGTTPLYVGNKPYRGRFVVTSSGAKLQVVNVLGLEAYLKGVVPSEMPSAWPADALKAQAVAARSYALANLTKGRGFDLYADTRSQVYGGKAAEVPSTSDAVDATAGEVVQYDGKVANTLFFSTSGGRTASYAEITGRSVPYLTSVADPYDTASPYHNWGPVLLDAAKVAKQLKVAGPLLDLRAQAGASGRVQKATLVTPTTQLTVSGTSLRKELELRSTWFTVGWLALTPPAKPVTYGGAATLAGVARGVGAVSLESRPTGGVWAPAGELVPESTGTFATLVKPTAITEYRLAAGTIRAAAIKVPVAPLVKAALAAGVATGTTRPVVTAAAVQLQRQDGTAWTTLATATTDAAGAFSVGTGAADPGVYRVRCAPGHGLAPGVSETMLVQ